MIKVAVQIESLTKTYQRGRIIALKEISLVVEKGEFLAVLGCSGSGKTTLLNMIGALDSPTEGKVTVEGIDISSVRNLNRFRAEKIGFVFQFYNLISVLNAYENVQIPLYGIKTSRKERRQRAIELLELVGLKDRLYQSSAMLSGGERQRVAIARALANRPPLMLVDEPTGSLDVKTGEEIIGLLCELNRKSTTTLMVVTHDPGVAKKADRIIQLHNGTIME